MDPAANEIFTLCNQVVCRSRKPSPEKAQKLTLAKINKDRSGFGREVGPVSELTFTG